MTVTPSTLRFNLIAYLDAATSPTLADYTLPVTSATLSEDMDRDNFGEVTLTMGWLDEDVFDALDPRYVNVNLPGQVRVQVQQIAFDQGSPSAYFPTAGFPPPPAASLFPRGLTRDYVSRTVTLTATTGELFMDEKLRLASGALNTGMTTLKALIEYAVGVAFPSVSSVTTTPTDLVTSIPAGTRRDFNSGDSALDLIRSELDAVDERLYDRWGFSWFTEARDFSGNSLVSLATAPNLDPDADPVVIDMSEVRSRDGRWADGVGVRFEVGGTAQWAGTGTSTKGILIDRNRPEPGANAATPIRARSMKRGRDLEITATARLDVTSRRPIIVWTPDTFAEGTIRSVEFSFPEGTMTIRMQS
jgi:hypothetical protein